MGMHASHDRLRRMEEMAGLHENREWSRERRKGREALSPAAPSHRLQRCKSRAQANGGETQSYLPGRVTPRAAMVEIFKASSKWVQRCPGFKWLRGFPRRAYFVEPSLVESLGAEIMVLRYCPWGSWMEFVDFITV